MKKPRGQEASAPAVTHGRRRFLLGGLSAAFIAGRGRAADLRIGLLLPPGPTAPWILRGAQMGAAEAETLGQMFGKKVELVQPPVKDVDAVAGAATRMLKEGVSVLVGGGDPQAAAALSEVAKDGKAIFLNVGDASGRLRSESCERGVFHLHASLEMHVGAAGLWLTEEKKARRWAVLTESAEMRQAILAFAEARGATVVEDLAAASGAADFGAALARLRAATPEALWLGLNAGALPGFLAQYGAAGLAGELVGILPDAPGLPSLDPKTLLGVWPVMWHHSLEKYSARELNSRYRRRFSERLDGPSWSAWAALKLVGEAMLRAGTTPQAIREYLEGDPPFDGHKGRPLTFRKSDHQLRQPMYLAQAGKGGPGGEGAPEVKVLAEVPRGDLDAIFLAKGGAGCVAS